MRRGLRFRGSKRRLRRLEQFHGAERWWVLLTLLLIATLAALMWALGS